MKLLPSVAFAFVCWTGISCVTVVTGGTAHAGVVADSSTALMTVDRGPVASVRALAYSADGSALLTLCWDGRLYWQSTTDGKTLAKRQLPRESEELRVLSDGSILTSSDDEINWWKAPALRRSQVLTVDGKKIPIFSGFVSTESTRQDEADAHGTMLPAPELIRKFTLREPESAATSVTGTRFRPRLFDFAVSSDGKTVATVMIDEERNVRPRKQQAIVKLWNTADGSTVKELDPIPFASVEPQITFTPDSLRLVVAYPDQTVRWLDVATGAVTREWTPPDTAVPNAEEEAAAMQAERDRRERAMPAELRGRGSGRVRGGPGGPRELPTPSEVALREGKFGALQDISLDGTKLLSATASGLRILNIATGAVVKLPNARRGPTSKVEFSPDGSVVTAQSENALQAWRGTGEELGTYYQRDLEVMDAAVSPDGNTLAVGGEDAQVRLWDAKQPLTPEPLQILPGFYTPIQKLASLGDDMLLSTREGAARVQADGKITWLPTQPIERPEPPANTPGQDTAVLAASPDGALFAETAYYRNYSFNLQSQGIPKGELRVRDAKTGAVVWRAPDTNTFDKLETLVWLPDGSIITGKRGPARARAGSQSDSEGIRRRDGKTGADLPMDMTVSDTFKRRPDLPYSLEDIAASADGKSIAMKDPNSWYILRDNVIVRRMNGFTDRPSYNSITGRTSNRLFSADGHWLIAGGQSKISFWDVARAQKDVEYNQPEMSWEFDVPRSEHVSVIALAPDETLVAGLSDGSLYAWKAPWTLDAKPAWQTTPTGSPVISLVFSKDGKQVWSGNARSDVRIRGSANGELQRTIRLVRGKTPDSMPDAETAPPDALTQNGAAGSVEKVSSTDKGKPASAAQRPGKTKPLGKTQPAGTRPSSGKRGTPGKSKPNHKEPSLLNE